MQGIYYNSYYEHAVEMSYDDFCLQILHCSPDMTLAEFHAREEHSQVYWFRDLDAFAGYLIRREEERFGGIIATIRAEQRGIYESAPF